MPASWNLNIKTTAKFSKPLTQDPEFQKLQIVVGAAIAAVRRVLHGGVCRLNFGIPRDLPHLPIESESGA